MLIKWFVNLFIMLICYFLLSLSLILLYTLPVNSNGYVPFLINTSDTIVSCVGDISD